MRSSDYRPRKQALAAALTGAGTAHVAALPDGTIESVAGHEVTALERILLDIVAEVRANLDRFHNPAPVPGRGWAGEATEVAATRLRTLCDCYEVLTQRTGAEALHLAVAVVAEHAPRKHQQAIGNWLAYDAPTLPEDRQLRDWPLTTFSVAEDRTLTRLRRRSPQLEDVSFTEDADTTLERAITAFDPVQHQQALDVLTPYLRRARVAGAVSLLVGAQRMVAVDVDRDEAWSGDHDEKSRAAYQTLRPRYADVLQITVHQCVAAPDHLLWEWDGRRRRL